MKNIYRVTYTSPEDFDIVELQEIQGEMVTTELLASTSERDQLPIKFFHTNKWKFSATPVTVKDLTLVVNLPYVSPKVEGMIKHGKD